MVNKDEKLTVAINQLREFDTALLANTIGYIDPTPPHEYYMGGSIGCLTPGLGPSVGAAVTCELESSTPNVKADWDLYWKQLDEISEIGVPVVGTRVIDILCRVAVLEELVSPSIGQPVRPGVRSQGGQTPRQPSPKLELERGVV